MKLLEQRGITNEGIKRLSKVVKKSGASEIVNQIMQAVDPLINDLFLQLPDSASEDQLDELYTGFLRELNEIVSPGSLDDLKNSDEIGY